MKAWVVRDYKEKHMANCLIAIAHSKPEGSLDCVEVDIIEDLQAYNEKIARAAFYFGRKPEGTNIELATVLTEGNVYFKYGTFENFLRSPEYKELVGVK